MSDRHVSAPSVRVERLLPAPVEQVFAAWTDPAVMSRWLSPSGRALAEVDLRVDGRFRVVMLGEAMRLEHTGRYLAVEPPHSLSFTWHSRYTGEEGSIVTITLRPEGDATHLLLVHDSLPAEVVSDHDQGWGTILTNLEGLLLRGPDDSQPV